mgnify:CR=1 FL=1
MLLRKLTLLFLLCSFFAQAQNRKFVNLGTREGLSQAEVSCILKDRKGFFWFGTQDGLNRYDGYNFTVFRADPDDPNSLSDNYINALFEDADGRIFVGTNLGGLNVFDPVTNSFSHFKFNEDDPKSLADNRVHCILRDREGDLLVGTDKGLCIQKKGTKNFIRITAANDKPKGLMDGSIRYLLEDKSGNIWVGTFRGGLHLFHKKDLNFSYFPATEAGFSSVGEKANKIKTLYQDRNGIIWIGTFNGGLLKFDPEAKKYLAHFVSSLHPNSLSHDWINAIAEDAEGNLWLATSDGGLCILDPVSETFSVQYADELDPYGLKTNGLVSVYRDEANNMWLGTGNSGVNVFFRNTTKFNHYKKNHRTENTLPDNAVYNIYQDQNGIIWLCIKGHELTRFDRANNQYQTFRDVCTASNKTILSLYEDPNGIFWLGSFGGGISLFNPKTGKSLVNVEKDFKGPPFINKTILEIKDDKEGNIWICTFGGGLYKLNPLNMELKVLNVESGLSHNRVQTLHFDADGILWVGTQGGVLLVVRLSCTVKKVIKAGAGEDNISSNSVFSFCEDGKGNMYVSTSRGLNRIDMKSGKIRKFYVKDGLANDNIYAILKDEAGVFWLSTNKGISKMEVTGSNGEQYHFKNYEPIDGLQEGEFIQGSYFLNPTTREMFFGGINGFNSFIPASIKENTHVPKVVITSFKRFGKPVALDTSIFYKKFLELSYKDNFFSIEFVSLDFTMPSKNLYSYKMEGVDQDWSIPSPIRFASYTNLEGGDYTFRVRASNNDGTWNEEGAVLKLRVIPPFWKTKTFYALCVLLSIIAVVAYTKWRTRSIEQEKKILEEKVAERTAELAQKNRDITSSIEYAKRIQEAILPEIKEIKKHFPESFVYYQPKDIVSGDFFWFGLKNGKKIIAAVDCTGHGVPGAFMSMIGHNLLSQIVMEMGETNPGKILDQLSLGVRNALKQGTHSVETRDGMDIALCVFDSDDKSLTYSGAFRPLILIRKGELTKYEGDKFSIGGLATGENQKFQSHKVDLFPGDSIYLFSDGYADQFGGQKGKKFMLKNLNNLLLSVENQPMVLREKSIRFALEEWKGDHEQVDDILVIGIKM